MRNGVRAQQREQTRKALLRESRRLFSSQGYAAVHLSEVVEAAGVTKGALYHHFESKAALFRAVLEEVQEEVAALVAATADAQEDSWDQLTSGCHAFLDATTDPSVQRIMLVDGPAVLGWRPWRAMTEATSGRHLADALDTLLREGTIPAQPVAPLTHLLSGAMNEAALWLATSEDSADLEATRRALTGILAALKAG
ncbi:TetR family transcriptional regulator [Streptomyces sp. CC53]|uniref:TetR/AcrR family transcriptional regulator n=1 Tax=unclassified Streptomyces TaxID=2593676 RepID=UPI0008DD9EA4|nr:MULTISPECIES: TetR/AcrR family transcriptional regulator [unclassified Streptomyces]OII62024.1 TetR family transcriptional regulator [Streptomyces sp. CC53]OII66906.1 TetR family transcriptional regulator [Streptomyces sp. CC77]